ncbi:MAG: biopolymer transport protein ExbB [Pirellulaceae bacterium]|jgi:biopolymer transport protein ExbB
MTTLVFAQDGSLPGGPDVNQTAGQTPVADSSPSGFWGILFSGGIVGAMIVLVLFLLSLTAAYLVFEQIMSIRRSELVPAEIGEQVRQLLAVGRISEADQICRANPSFLSFVLISGLAEIEGGWSSVEKAMEDALAEQSARLLRKIEYLSVIGNIAPMVGLLGTVTGMIFAFQQVATTQGGATAGQLAEGIYQALVTTVGGLIVAIPSLGAFAIFRNRVDQFTAEAAYVALHSFSPIKRRFTAVTPPPPPAEETK